MRRGYGVGPSANVSVVQLLPIQSLLQIGKKKLIGAFVIAGNGRF